MYKILINWRYFTFLENFLFTTDIFILWEQTNFLAGFISSLILYDLINKTVQVCAVSIVTIPWVGQPKYVGSISSRGKRFFSFLHIHTALEPTQPLFQWVLVLKLWGHYDDCPSPFSAEASVPRVFIQWSGTTLPYRTD